MQVIEELLQLPTTHNLFNPYTSNCQEHDKIDANKVRTDNITRYFNWIEKHEPADIIVGEAYGWRGGRRTGLPFTDDLNLDNFTNLYHGMETMNMATKEPMKEQSATMVWNVFKQLETPPAMWNVIPIHPHPIDEGLANRTPKRTDYALTKRYTARMINHYKFKRVFAIGNKAFDYLKKEVINLTKIRHPSYGGKNEFIKGMFSNFGKKTL